MGGQNLAGLTTTRLPTDSRRPEDASHAACVTESRAWGGGGRTVGPGRGWGT